MEFAASPLMNLCGTWGVMGQTRIDPAASQNMRGEYHNDRRLHLRWLSPIRLGGILMEDSE